MDLAVYDGLRQISDIKLDANWKPDGSDMVLGMDVELGMRQLSDRWIEYERKLLAFEFGISLDAGRISFDGAVAGCDCRSGERGDHDGARSREHTHHDARPGQPTDELSPLCNDFGEHERGLVLDVQSLWEQRLARRAGADSGTGELDVELDVELDLPFPFGGCPGELGRRSLASRAAGSLRSSGVHGYAAPDEHQERGNDDGCDDQQQREHRVGSLRRPAVLILDSYLPGSCHSSAAFSADSARADDPDGADSTHCCHGGASDPERARGPATGRPRGPTAAAQCCVLRTGASERERSLATEVQARAHGTGSGARALSASRERRDRRSPCRSGADARGDSRGRNGQGCNGRDHLARDARASRSEARRSEGISRSASAAVAARRPQAAAPGRELVVVGLGKLCRPPRHRFRSPEWAPAACRPHLGAADPANAGTEPARPVSITDRPSRVSCC